MSVLKTLVEPDIKTRFRAMARARSMSESELLREVVLAAVASGVDAHVPVEPDVDQADLERMTVRMPRFLMEATKTRAKARGMAPSRFVCALVQSNMTKTPVMTDEEVKALLASGRELAAIGRNINQIARALNISCDEASLEVANLPELIRVVAENRKHIRELVRASQNVWDIE